MDSVGDIHAFLTRADCIVSTAHHEFFGLAVAEAAAAGCLSLLPPRLAYTQLFPPDQGQAASFYDVSLTGLADVLAGAAARLAGDDFWQRDPARARRAVERFAWPVLAPQFVGAVAAAAGGKTA